MDLSRTAVTEELTTDEELFVSVARGTAEVVATGVADAVPRELGEGDALLVGLFYGAAKVTLSGKGLVVVARARPVGPTLHDAQVPQDGPPSFLRFAKAGTRAPLRFAKGRMAAYLDVEGPIYLGRLTGTAPVAEHSHPGSWEILAAIDAKGTFTLAGKTRRLRPGEIVAVPPDAKHSWQPDDGEPLRAVQMYWPSGPEQRFKKLASEDEADGAR